MSRIRITLLLLALGVGIPAALLVLRATESLELESAYRHDAVAERVFDEMERSLSDFLLREEPRPPRDYDLGLPAVGASTPASSIFTAADEPFILGWFSVDASRRIRLLAVRRTEAARLASAIEASLGPRDPASDAGEAGGASLAALGLTGTEELAPGRTKSSGKAALEKKEAPATDEESLADSSAYEVLQNLNRAQSLRIERQSKGLREPAPEARAAAAPPVLAQADRAREQLDAPAEFSAEHSLRSIAIPSAESDATGSAQTERLDSVDAFAEGARSTVTRRNPAADTQSVDPMIGRSTASGEIVLTRSVWRGGRVDRQGLVLDRAALVAWLRERVLSETGLAAHARVDFAPPDFPARVEAEHRYLHRFAEPFDGLVARLDLDSLSGVGTVRPIYAMALLLTLVGSIGLFAVDRMTRVVLEYAQRRSNFVAAVSHELKTPLTAIRMYGEMLRDGRVGSEAKRAEYYETITSESERLSRLIDNVLEFSRLEQGRRELELVTSGLAATLREAVGKLRPHAQRAGFRIELDLAEPLPPVRYDRDALTQILFNLVDNAIKYARQAERREISIRLVEHDGRVELRVRDFGPGVPRDQQARIFEPFYRVGDELTRTTEGTGIGLALVKELVEASGGSVRATHPDDGGFEVILEFAPAP